jgi:hypothetical protein
MNTRKLTLTTLATLCAMTSVLVLDSTQAFAYLKHEYVSQITGTPEGPFKNACAFTIDPASQDLYVANFGNNAIDIFEPSGTSGYTYKSHFNGPVNGPKEDLFSGGADCNIAVSDVTGDLYVESSAPSPKVFVFNSLGSYLEELNGSTTPNEFFYGSVHMTVDQSSGDIYIFDSFHEIVDRFNKANEYQSQLAIPNTSGTFGNGLAVDSHGVLYVGDNNEHLVYEYNASGVKIGEFADAEPGSIAVDAKGNIYVASILYKNGGVVDEFDSSGVLEGQTTGTPTGRFFYPQVAVNAIGDPYVLSGSMVDVFGPAILVPDVSTQAPSNLTSTTATLNGTVNAKGTQVTSCEFEYGLTTAYGQIAACEPTPTGSNPEVVSANVKGLQAGTEYHYRLVARNPNGYNESEDATFFTPGPQVQKESFSEVGLHRVTVDAQVNPEGLPTTYTVEYGTSEAYGSTTVAASVGTGTEFRNITNTLGASSGNVLQPDTTYHFRVVATNADGTRYGSDVTFTTWPGFAGLPDGRGYEMVSPVANADGNVYFPGSGEISNIFEGQSVEESGLPIRASADGNAVQYVSSPQAAGGDGQLGVGLGNKFVATRNPGGGWTPVDLETPGLPYGASPYEALFSNELSNSGTSIVSAGSHSLTENKKGLFASVGGRLVPVSVLPDGTMISGATFGDGSEIDHVISADGSRIFWTDTEKDSDENHIFVRENGERTVQVSAGAALYWTASSDGKYVFYTENETLWRFDVESETREELAGEGAGVLGVIGVNETGEDGAYVYFVAQSVLAPGAVPGNCVTKSIEPVQFSGNCNLYMRHNGVTSLVTTLLGQDDDIQYSGLLGGIVRLKGDWAPGLGERTAQVTPDGHSVVFMSSANLTSYNKEGVAEVYVYDAHTGRVSCASCQPTGVPPSGMAGLPWTGITAGSTFQHRWISEDGSRVFFNSTEALVGSDTNGVQDVYEWEREGSGSCQVRVPVRQDGGCVYLLSGGTSSDKSYFLDSSASGNDVFMITRAELTPQDQGETYEVYDARVGAGEPPSEPVCTGTGCQGLPTAPPFFATPSSVTFNGVGNFPPSAQSSAPRSRSRKVRCTKGKMVSHGKCVKPKGKNKGKKARKSGRDRGAK